MRIVTEYLERSAEKYPNKIAFSDENREISFSSLQDEAKKIATAIIKFGYYKAPIIVLMDKSVECIASFMGIAYSGNFYTPLDIKMPIERMKKILSTLKPIMVITNEKNRYILDDLNFSGCILEYQETMCLPVENSLINQVTEKIIDSDVLYVLFTSGSTGNPKGAIISHRSVIDYIEWVTEKFHLNENSILGNQAPLYFDLSVQDIYAPLKTGGMTCLIDSKNFVFPIKLLELIKLKNIDTVFWVPSVLVLIANLKALSRVKTNLKKVLFCGEVMPNKQLNLWRAEYPNTAFINLYGPTEITEVCTYFVVNRKFSDDEPLPIGKPCENTDIMVLNEQNELVKNNEIGELCVRGSSLSHGYYRNPEKTKEVFVQNPLNDSYPEIIYRTGDLVKYNEYGEIVYVSRKDFQIKHMGNRIELGEIETIASAINGVDVNACVYDEKKAKIVMFYVGSISDKELIKKLKIFLPEYMIPNQIKVLDVMPFNLNGKIDRVKLKDMVRS